LVKLFNFMCRSSSDFTFLFHNTWTGRLLLSIEH
jgi:hypothetical protein